MNRLAVALLARAIPLIIASRTLYRRITRPVESGVRALVIDRGQLLLVRTHGSTRWDMPGGGVHRGELLRTAAVREAREETGCAVVPEYLLGLYTSLHQGMTNHVAVFVCRPLGSLAPQLNIEIAEARYWPLDALPADTHPAVGRRLAEYRAGAHGVDGAW